ncbi:MAG: DUF4234 domain-containing protein [Haloferacaceae archaeon]
MSADGDGFAERSIGKAVGLFVITLGFYGIYWIHRFHTELRAEGEDEFSPLVRTVGMAIPLYNLYVMWQDCQGIEETLGRDATTSFLLWLFLAPVWWFLVQSSINERARGGA